MPVAITYRKPQAWKLGSAEFRSAIAGDRTIEVDADADRLAERPISLYTFGGGQQSFLYLTTEEAETLATLLIHAVALRREADAEAQTKKAA